MLTQQLLNGITLGSIYALIALGYTMVYGIIQLINFAHGEILMFGTYITLILITVFHVPPLIAVLLAMAASALLGVTIERIAYRPLRESPKLDVLTFFAALIASFTTILFTQSYQQGPLGLVVTGVTTYLFGFCGLLGNLCILAAQGWGWFQVPTALLYAMAVGLAIGFSLESVGHHMNWFPKRKQLLYSLAAGLLGNTIAKTGGNTTIRTSRLAALISALGVSIFLQNLAMLIWGTHPLSFPSILPNTRFTWGGIPLSSLQLTIFLVSLSLMILLVFFVQKTKLGRAMRATALDRECASLLGVNPSHVIALTFAIGSALAAVAGIMVSSYYHTVFPTIGYFIGLKAFAAAVLGGIGNIPGAMLGGFVLGIVEILGISGIPLVHQAFSLFIGGLIGYTLGSRINRKRILPKRAPPGWGARTLPFGTTAIGGGLGLLLLSMAEQHGFQSIPSGYQDAISFAVLILVLVFRPTGLLGEQIADKA